MMRSIAKNIWHSFTLFTLILMPASAEARGSSPTSTSAIVDQVIRALMRREGIPGVVVGIVSEGRSAVYCFGVQSKETGKPVDRETLFEIGSISKTFTATLAAYAQEEGRLSLRDPASARWPALRGTAFDEVTLLDLGTHTSGGMPLQFPDEVVDEASMLAYFRAWRPTHAPGTYRTYANPSIGLLGLIAARSLGGDFDELESRLVFGPLGMHHTFLTVPPRQFGHYAQGYTSRDVPVRLSAGMLAAEAYGIRTTADDMLRFVEANIGDGPAGVPVQLRAAVHQTHTGYFRVGSMTQDLIWEQYRYPAALPEVQAGNSSQVSFRPNPVVALRTPLPPEDNVLVNKTGSTNGFAAYVAFVPAKRIGVVLLANKNFPIEARVDALYDLLSRLEAGSLLRLPPVVRFRRRAARAGQR